MRKNTLSVFLVVCCSIVWLFVVTVHIKERCKVVSEGYCSVVGSEAAGKDFIILKVRFDDGNEGRISNQDTVIRTLYKNPQRVYCRLYKSGDAVEIKESRVQKPKLKS